MVIYFEVYGSPEWTPGATAVTFELAGAGASAPAVSAPATLRPAGTGRWAASAELQLRGIAPGAYMASARIAVPGAEPQRLTRSFVVTR